VTIKLDFKVKVMPSTNCVRSWRCDLFAIAKFLWSYVTLNIMTLKYGLKATEGHSNRYHSKVWVQFPIRLP